MTGQRKHKSAQATNEVSTARSSQAPGPRPVVVHVLDRLGVGGMETVAVNVIERTRERYRHRVICLRDTGTLGSRLQAMGVDVSSVDKRPGKDWGAYWRLCRLLRRATPDIVHTYNIGALDVAVWARLAGVRHVVHAEHGRDFADPHGRNFKYRWLRRCVAPAIDAFVPVSSDLSRWLDTDIGIRKSKIRMIRNGIDVERYRPCTSVSEPVWPAGFAGPGTTVFGTVGRLDPVKGFSMLLDAFAQLCDGEAGATARLVIIGDGGERDRLVRQVERLGIGDRVWLAGERDDVPAILRSLDVYVCSSIAEGIALTILEAMASALPVIATRVGGNPELVEADHTGLLVAADDAMAMASAMRVLVAEPQRARAMGQAGRVRACEQFSIDAMSAEYCRLYDGLLETGNGSSVLQARS